jgi:hypothetical protein
LYWLWNGYTLLKKEIQMSTVLKLIAGGLLGVAVISSCGLGQGLPVQSHGGSVRDHVSFVDQLRSRGLTVDIAGVVAQPFLAPDSGTRLKLSGAGFVQPAEVQSFDYATASAARADAAGIGPDGNPPKMMITWTAPPHFYLKERVLVLYVGSDPTLRPILDDLLGPQFAGKPW